MENTNELPLVLVAEDEPANFRLAEILLRTKYRLIHAWDGEEAVKLCDEQKPDIILMDIQMPNMDGYEAFNIIKKKSPEIPVIACSAYAMKDDIDGFVSMGFEGFIAKPVRLALFDEIVAHHTFH